MTAPRIRCRLARSAGGQVVHVDDETHAALKRLAKERGDSMARVLEGLIYEAVAGARP